MADIQSNIHIGIDTSDAMASIKMLQSQMSAFHTSMARGTATQLKASQQLQQGLINSINATKQFSAGIQTIKTSTESFTTALEKNKLSLGQYFKYSVAATKSFGGAFKTEMATIDKVARERVKDLQTQYIKLGRDANGAMKAIAVRPLMLDLENLQTKTAIAAQKQQILNQLLKQGSTNLLNWGKNTQWAGRQLMVGFTIPLSMAGTAAAKAYMEIEKASIQIKRVYGDLNTTAQETNKMVAQIKALAGEYTKYGIAISDTMAMAAKAAAMGKTGVDLLTQVDQASKLAALGNVDQNTALETTISLTNSFGTEVEKLSGKINFLNAVENQTVLSLEDMTIAIPKAAPIVKQLGGDVEDLAFFLTAMKEGGINASEGANALKSGLASLINPTKASSEFLAQFGVNVKQIVENDKGNLKKTVVDFASALDKIDPLNRARAIEMMFGKFQFSRISTLLQNVTKEGSQASRALELANMSSIQLAAISRKELEKLESSPMYKFQKSLADLQIKIAPIGETFLKAVTPVIEKVGDFLDGFNKMGDGFKQFVVVGAALLGGLAPVLLMVTGLIANGAANIIKLFSNVKAFLNKTSSESQVLGETTSYLTSEQIKAEAVAASLDQTHTNLRQTLTAETSAVIALMEAYQKANAAMISVPAMPTTIPARTARKMAGGGMVVGPGGPKDDLVPADLSNGEAVIDAATVKKNPRIISALFAGRKINIPGYKNTNKDQFKITGSRRINRTDAVEQGHLDEVVATTYDDALSQILDSISFMGDTVVEETRAKIEAKLKKSGIDPSSSSFFAYNENLMRQPQFLNNAGASSRDMRGIIEFYKEQGISTFDNLNRHLVAAGVPAEKIRVILENASTDLLSSLSALPKNAELTNEELQRLANASLDAAVADEELAKQTLARVRETKLTFGIKEGGRVNRGTVVSVPETIRFGQGYRNRNEENANLMSEMYGVSGYKPGAAYVSGDVKEVMLQLKDSGGRNVKIFNRLVTELGMVEAGTKEYDAVLKKINSAVTKLGLEETKLIPIVKSQAKAAGDSAAAEASAAAETKKQTGAKKARAAAIQQEVSETQALKIAIKAEKDTILRSLLIKKQQADRIGADTALIDQEIKARKDLIAKKQLEANASARNAVATDINTNEELIDAGSVTAGSIVGSSEKSSKKPGRLGKISAGIGGKMGIGIVASMAASSLAMIPGVVGETVSSFMPLISILSMIGPFLSGPVLAGIAALSAGFIGISFLINEENKARKKQIDSISALSNTFTAAEKSVRSLEGLLGSAPRKSGIDFAAGDILNQSASKTNDVQTLLQSEAFKSGGDMATLAESFSKIATKQERSAFLSSYATMLSGKGYGDVNIDSLIAAIQQKAGKTDIEFNFKSIKVGTKGGDTAIAAATGTLLADMQKADVDYEKYKQSDEVRLDIENRINTINKQRVGTELPQLIKGTKAYADEYDRLFKYITKGSAAEATWLNARNASASSIKNFMQGISDQFINGQISQKGYNRGISLITNNINNLSTNAEKLSTLKTIFSQMDPAIQAVANSLTNVSGQILYLQSAMLGLGSLTGEEISALNGENTRYVGSELVQGDPKKAEEARKAIIARMKKRVEEMKKLNEEIYGNNNAGGGTPTEDPFITFLKNAKERRKSVAAELSIRKELLRTGLSIADAEKLAADSSAQQAYMAADTAEEKQQIINLLREQLSLEDVLLTKEQKRANADKKAVDDKQKEIDKKKAELGIPEQEAKLGQYNDALEVLAPKEEAINKLYDERAAALDKIQNANEAIAESQQDQLSLADALSKGDIAAAARAAQDMKTKAAARQAEDQRNKLDQSRQRDLDSLTVSINGQLLTRKQIEEQINKIQANLSKLQLDYISNMEIALAKLQQTATISSQVAETSGNNQDIVKKPDPSSAAKTAYGNAFKVLGNVKATDAEKKKAQASIDWFNKKYVAGYAVGGHILGEGTATSDSIPAWLSNGEYVVKASAVKKLGVPFLDHLNNNAPKYADGGFVEPKNTGNSFVDILKSIFFTPLNMAKDIHKSVKNIFTGKASGEDALNVASILPIGKGISLLGKGAIGLKNVLSATGKIAGANVGSKLEQVALEKFITNPKFGYSTSLGMKEPLESLVSRNNITAGYEMYRSLTPGELNRILKATKGGKDYIPGQVRSVAGSSDLQTLGQSASKTGEINFGGQNSYANTIAKITAMEDLAGIQNVNRFGDLSQLAQEGLLGAQTRYQLLKHIPSSDPKIPGIMHFGAYRHANGGFVAPKYFAKGGDVVPAMLTPGEFVVSQPAVKKFGVDNLRAINNGTSIGDSVYNYSLSVNMSGSNLNPNDVARTVIAQIKQIDAQRLRGNRF